ncbi:MAG: hypothetical protein Q7J25_13840 [Vicinamibacterales bacterium]|nr:hypothetical protein [Vicinamibacterales bacterium]
MVSLPPDAVAERDCPPYLTANADFYETFWTTTRFYTSRFPNVDEASRAAVILESLSGHAEGCEPVAGLYQIWGTRRG